MLYFARFLWQRCGRMMGFMAVFVAIFQFFVPNLRFLYYFLWQMREFFPAIRLFCAFKSGKTQRKYSKPIIFITLLALLLLYCNTVLSLLF